MITLNHLFSLNQLTPIHPAAGKTGMNRLVTGVNVTESDHLAEFFKENELLVTTGIYMMGNEESLIAMVETAFQRKASGIVINVGPYIPKIPDKVLQFADDHQFPVFEMPWEYRIADFVKETIQFLAAEQKVQIKNNDFLSELLFHRKPDLERIARELAQEGIPDEQVLGIIVCELHPLRSIPPALVHVIESELSKRYNLLLSTTEENQLIFMVDRSDVRRSQGSLAKIVKDINASYQRQAKLNIAMGNYYSSIADLPKSFQEAVKVIHLARRHPEHLICEYKDLGAYKLIMEIGDQNVLETFYHDTLGMLYRYDRLHDTDLVRFLKVFLEEDGRTASIARKEFIHRNTVLYKTKKIEQILGIDLSSSFTKTSVLLAFMIENMMEYGH